MLLNRSGVYVIEHVASGRRYVGSAVDVGKRWKEHRRQLATGRHHSPHLQRAWNKHGETAFAFHVIAWCPREHLIACEQMLIDGLRPAFNCSPTAGSQLGYRHRPETRQKMSASRAKDWSPMRGRHHTEATKRRISENRKGKGGGERSAERRAKISAALKGREVTPEMRARISQTLSGRRTGRGSLSEDQVRQVRAHRADGWGRLRIARHMGISEWAADAVIGGHAYMWVA
jgi:group I intron endonuclease